jgi:hypothetical protein
MLDVDSRSQPYEVTALDAAGVLEHLRDAEQKKRIAERSTLRLALQYCRVHQVADPDEAATWGDHERGSAGDCDDRLGNEGTPMIRAGVAPAFGAALGVSTGSAMGLLSNALDLQYRFPLIHAQVEELAVQLWKARRVAEFTWNLSLEACAFIDSELAARAQGFGMVTLERKIAVAIARFHPELLPEAEQAAKDLWDVTLEHARVEDFTGTSGIEATGDTLGLTRFYELVCTVAKALGKLGDTDTYAQRKAKAIGIIAVPEEMAALLDRAESAGEEPGDDTGSGKPRPRPAKGALLSLRKPARIKFNLHFSAADLAALEAETGEHHVIGEVEKLGPLTLAKIREWLATSGATITPVIDRPIDLNRTDARDPHDPPAWMREQVILRDKHCVFPWCERDARSCDLDHIEPYIDGPGAPPGQTRPDGLACLCRTHHLCKTFHGWTYRRLPDGSYRWKDPHGHTYLVTENGTTDLG